MRRTVLPLGVRRLAVLVRFPSVAVAVVASATILGVSAGAGPMFASSVANGVISSALRDRGSTLLTVPTESSLAADVVTFQQRRLEAALRVVPAAGALRATLRVPGLAIRAVASPGTAATTTEGSTPAKVQLVSRTGFEAHVHVVDRDPSVGDGVWIAESTAVRANLAAGDTVALTDRRRSVTAPVAGVYRDLVVGEQDPFWAPLAAMIYPAAEGDDPPPPPVLADEGVFLRCSTVLQAEGVHGWDVGVRNAGELGFDAAVATADRVRGLLADLAVPRTEVGAGLQATSASSPFLGVVRDARVTRDGLAGPVRTFATAGEVAALLGLLAAAVYGVRRRRIEVRMLDAAGISRVSFGARSAVEAAIPVIAGVGAGCAIARGLVVAFGASSSIDPGAVDAAIRAAGLAAIAALLLFGAGAAASMRDAVTERRERAEPGVGTRIPWEVAALAAAGIAYYEVVHSAGRAVVARGGAVRLDAFVLLFPVLFILGGAGVILRIVVGRLGRLRARAGRWPVPVFLAARRLSAASGVALLLMTSVALAIGILVYSASVGASLVAATAAKARLGVGADVAGSAPQPLSFPPARGVVATNVVRVLASSDPGGAQTTVIGIDPSTFAAVAFWDDAFADHPLPALMADLAAPGGTTPVLLDGGSARVASIGVGGFTLPVRVVATATAFPGQASGSTIVVSTPALERALAARGLGLDDVGAEVEVWAHGRTARAVSYLEGLGVPAASIRTADTFVHAPNFRAISSSFGFMELLGVLAALVAVIGVVLYLQARQRARLIAYAMASRMGLSSGGHRAAVALELGLILLIAAAAGTILAIVAGAAMTPWIDPLPSVAPTPTFRTPGAVLLVVSIGAPLIALLGGALVQRRTDRSDVAEALRYAG